MAEAIECLLCKWKALSANSSPKIKREIYIPKIFLVKKRKLHKVPEGWENAETGCVSTWQHEVRPLVALSVKCSVHPRTL
jgi:hypothetical protein